MQGNAQFAEKVAQWQRKLGTVDVVLNTWAEVQKKWANLESIFVGSADIRVQLPEDSKRFDAVNTDFQVNLPTRKICQSLRQQTGLPFMWLDCL